MESTELRPFVVTLLAVVAMVAAAGCGSEELYPHDPLSPQSSIERFQLSTDTFAVEVFASEPDVIDPVSMSIDKNGRAYIVEMRDFPWEVKPENATSTIRLVEDTDNDGRIDRSTVFADSLSEVTSALPWKGGILVTAAPDILYLKDTDGDRKADHREVVFTGFFTGNNEAQITNLRYGIDNWIYASNAGNPSEVVYMRDPDSDTVSIRGWNFRFRLDRGEFEPAAGPSRFGLTQNDRGHQFLTRAVDHVRHVVIPYRYLIRNPDLKDRTSADNINDHGLRMYQISDPPHWRVVRTERRNERYDEEGIDRTAHASGYFTGATGGTVYSAKRFPESFHGNLFTADISGNLLHRDILQSDGVTYTASRPEIEQKQEFLATTDPWFRPTNFYVGPDGNLYVTDIYRLHVESPMSVPADLKQDMNYNAGDTLGRVYRIVPKGAERADNGPALGEASTEALAELLSHPNRWWRLTAQRLLVERQDKAVVSRLRQQVRTGETPEERLHSLYALEGLNALTMSVVRQGLNDSDPGVREHALRLAERYQGLRSQVAEMVDDPSARVRLQVALSLGEFSGSSVREALRQLADAYGDNAWMRKAIRSSEIGASVYSETK